MNPTKTERKKNWMVIAGGKRFLMGGQEEITREDALRESRLIWPGSEVA